jgi:hypothetical protein
MTGPTPTSDLRRLSPPGQQPHDPNSVDHWAIPAGGKPVSDRHVRTGPARMPTGRHRPVGSGPVARGRARTLLDLRGRCRQGGDPGSWFVVWPDRRLLEREAAQVRARVLCAGCPVLGLCRRTVLGVLSAPASPPGRRTAVRGVWGGLAQWEVRAVVRRARKRRVGPPRPPARRGAGTGTRGRSRGGVAA